MTAQGRRDQALLNIDKRSDPWGTPYFWFGFERPPSTLVAGTDLAAIDQRRISVTPLCLDLTHEATCRQLQERVRAGAGRQERGARLAPTTSAIAERRRPDAREVVGRCPQRQHNRRVPDCIGPRSRFERSRYFFVRLATS